MSERSIRIKAAAQRTKDDPLRSPLFRWLKRNHRLIPPATSVRRDWAPLIDKAVQAGVTDCAGQPPSLRMMRDTWRKVLFQLEVEAAQAASPPSVSPFGRKRYPRDLPADARPMPVTASAPARLYSPSSVSTPVPASSHNVRLKADENGMVLGHKVTEGIYLPEPDYKDMTRAEASNARQKWLSLRNR